MARPLGKVSKGAGTHMASWLQEVGNIGLDDARIWLAAPRADGIEDAVSTLKALHGKNAGHSGEILDADASGQLVVTKDKGSMRLWRRRDGELLRVVTCRGNAVAFGTNGNNLVTGDVDGEKVKVWGAAGGSAFTAGKKNIGNGLYT